MERRPSLGSALALVMGLAAAAVAVVMNDQFLHRPVSGPVDLLPLVLGAKAILAGLDPNDPAVLEALYRQSPDIQVRAHGFHNYYPPTACLLMVPLALLPFQWVADLFYWGGMAALVAAGWFLAGAGRSRGRLVALAAALTVGSVFLQLRLARVVLPSGQVSPFIVLLTAAALWGLARPRSWLAVGAFTVGAAIKLFPLVLLPGALAARRWRWLWATLGVGVAFGACMWIWRHGTGGLDAKWLFGAARFVVDAPQQAWADLGPAWLPWLWKLRLPGLGSLTLALLVVAAWRRPEGELTTACAGLLAAFGGVAMAGGHHYHESIMLLPAVGFVLCWPAVKGPRVLQWASAVTLLVAMIGLGAFARFVPRNPPHWLPLGYLTWAFCALRWGWALWAQRRDVV